MFAFVALLKRQFLLEFKKRFFYLSLSLLFFYAIFFCFIFYLFPGFDIFGRIFAASFTFPIFRFILIFSKNDILFQDLKNNNKNISVSPVNVYLINFSYLFYSFIVDFFVKTLFSLVVYVAIFFKLGIFYYQTIWFILLENFLFAVYTSVIGNFLTFFCFKFIRYVQIIVFIFSIAFAPIRDVLTKIINMPSILSNFIVDNQLRSIKFILGLEFWVDINRFYSELIVFLILVFLMLFIQNLFVFVYNEKKFNKK